MASRTTKLRVELLDERIVPDATPLAVPPGVTALVAPPTLPQQTVLSNPNTGGSGSYGGIDPLNPLPNLGLPAVGAMPAIDPVKEAAILQSLTAELGRINVAIQALNPNDPNYQADLAALQLRQGVAQSGIQDTQAIATNVVAAVALNQQLLALQAQIQPLLNNPNLTVGQANSLAGLLAQYSALCAQMNQLVADTQQLFAARSLALNLLGLADPYAP